MKNSKSSDWQHPFVDVFKRYDVYDRNQGFKGSVSSIHDTSIARKCLKLLGATPSNSTVTIPFDSTMELTGRYIYLQMIPVPGKFFVIRIQIGIKNREPGVKFVLTNMEKENQVQGGNTLNITLSKSENEGWNIYCVDIQHYLQSSGLVPKSSNVSQGNYYVKKIQVCANLTIRGIFTSDNVYDWNSLPREMGFKNVKGMKWDDFYNFRYFPDEIKPETVRQNKRKQDEEDQEEAPVEEQLQVTQKPPLPRQKPIIRAFPEEQIAQLGHTFAYSPLDNPDIALWENKLCYSSGSLIIWNNLESGQQDFLVGHTDYIIAMDSNEDWLVTAQRGPKAIMRVWIGMKCVNSFQAPCQKVQQVRLNKAKHLAIVGFDNYNRQVIMIFDLIEVVINKQMGFIAKQVSDFNILTLKWSPVETDKLVSCGRQNIRFWRIKSQHLPGTPVILNHHARNTIFNVLDFQRCFNEPNPLTQLQKIQKVYVGTKQGLLFQIHYHTHELLEIFKLHEGGICSLVLKEGNCITGGEDQAIRIWPLDFSEYILEADHEGAVTSLAITQDGEFVVCGTSTGGLGVLDLESHNYRSILRSHTGKITQLVYHTFSQSLITLSDDLTIRLWDPQKLEQTYEFTSPKDDPCCCISGNPLGLYFAAGFRSGILRIFDVQQTGILQEIHQHTSQVCFVEYSPDGRFLIVIDRTLAMLYSPLHQHQPIKHLPTDMPTKTFYASFSPDCETLAVIGDSSTHVDLWNTSSLQLVGKLFTGKATTKVVFSPNGDLWCVFQDCSLKRYDIHKLTVEVEMSALHKGSINGIAFDLDRHLLFTVGEDSLLKLWDYSFQREPHKAMIGHVGPINGVVFQNGKIWTIGSQGMFMWRIKKGLPKFEPTLIKSRPANFIKVPVKQKGLNIVGESSQINDHQQGDLSENIDQPNPHRHQPILFSQKLRQRVQEQIKQDIELAHEPIPMDFQPRTLVYRRSKKREHKNRVGLGLSAMHLKNNLPFNHFYKQKMQHNEMVYNSKINMIKENPPKFNIRFLIGNERYGHDTLAVNWVLGWFAYILDNLLIIDSFGKDRIQKIVPMPQKLGQLLVSKDSRRLFVSSVYNPTVSLDLKQSDQGSVSSMSQNLSEGQFANIYVFNRNWQVQRKLSFHTRGVQAMAISNDSRYLVSIGSFRECTVCVWEVATGRLRASNYTLDKLNDVKIAEFSHQGTLDFVTVGRDQINFWTLSKEDKLQYHDVFIPKTKEGNLVEITACEYIGGTKLIIGLTNGQIMILSTETYRTVSNRLVCNSLSQITTIRQLRGQILIGTMAGDLNIMEFGSVLNQSDITSMSKISLKSPVMSICLDQDGQGLIGTSDGIYFANIKQKFHSIFIGNYTSPVTFSRIIDDSLFLTVHQNCQICLWSLKEGVLIRTYKWKTQCMTCYYDSTSQKIFCFLDKPEQIKIINVKKFSKDQTFQTDGHPKDSILQAADVAYGDFKAKWAFSGRGEVYAFELVEQKKKKSVKMVKVLELSTDLADAFPVSKKNLLFVTSKNGLVSSYTVQTSQNQTKYALNLIDKVFFGQNVNPSEDKLSAVHLGVNRNTGDTYFSVVEGQPYIYMRNFMKRVTVSKILLSSNPKSICLLPKKESHDIIVGLQDGSLNIVDCFEPEKRHTLASVVNNPVESILTHKGQVVLVHKTGCAIYSF